MLRRIIRRPLLGNICLYATLYGSGEMCQQLMVTGKVYNAAAFGQLGAVGAGLAPMLFYWYRLLDRYLVRTCARGVMLKICCDQLAAPAFITAFFIGSAITRRKESWTHDLRQNGLRAFQAGLLYWPVVQALNFRFLPSAARAPYVAGAAFLYSIFLCNLTASPTSPAVSV